MPKLFVTGAGKGIGRAIAERFASAGWEVAGITRSAGDVARLNQLPLGRFRQADAADAAAVSAAVADLVGEDGLDILVNNAGCFRYGGFRDATPDLLAALWRANVLTAHTVTQALLPALLRARGRIANIVSLAALKPMPGKAAYCASKTAQAALFRCLRDEISADGVTVTNIYPGVTLTRSFDGEDVDPADLMAAEDVAEATFRNLTSPGNLVAEELVLQPANGIRL